jgi:periplasmic divalent cation tolerance protein
MEKSFIIFCTASSVKEARKIADALVAEKLAACVSIVPGVASAYWWQGKIEHSAEALLVIKTLASKRKALELRIKELHSYSVPEIIGWPIAWGHKPYLEWLEEINA